ncbi:MAG: WhiB family transcriptional regulator [Actinomycetota bacterium]|nr:WhiB family transcriptional regulator [Actinomycetota bacterium]
MGAVPDIEWESGWRSKAACTGADTDLFFPGGTTGEALVRIERAKVICRSCPCCDACLDFAIRTNQEFGVWGAASEEDRRKMRRFWLSERRVAT